jgi:hypothetical protein
MHYLESEFHVSEKPALPSTFEELADSLFAQLPDVPCEDYVTNSSS